MSILFKIALYTALIFGISKFIPGVFLDAWWPTAVIAGLVFALINTVIKPVLKIVTLPISILTFGLFSVVLNSALFWLVGYLVNGFDVSGWLAAFLGGLVASIGAMLVNSVVE